MISQVIELRSGIDQSRTSMAIVVPNATTRGGAMDAKRKLIN